MIDCTNCIHFISDNNIYFECEYGLDKRQDFNTYKRCDLKVINDNEREETMPKILAPEKEYKVSGNMLMLICSLADLYNMPCQEYDAKNGETKVLHFPSEKRDYLIGRLVQEFEYMEWEEL